MSAHASNLHNIDIYMSLTVYLAASSLPAGSAPARLGYLDNSLVWECPIVLVSTSCSDVANIDHYNVQIVIDRRLKVLDTAKAVGPSVP